MPVNVTYIACVLYYLNYRNCSHREIYEFSLVFLETQNKWALGYVHKLYFFEKIFHSSYVTNPIDNLFYKETNFASRTPIDFCPLFQSKISKYVQYVRLISKTSFWYHYTSIYRPTALIIGDMLHRLSFSSQLRYIISLVYWVIHDIYYYTLFQPLIDMTDEAEFLAGNTQKTRYNDPMLG